VAAAVIVQEPGTNGAVYDPLFRSMLPQVADHVATTFVENCCGLFSTSVTIWGVMLMAGGGPMVSTAVVVYAVPPVAVAVILQIEPCAGDAVNSPPFGSIIPHEAAQVAGMFAPNCCVCP
jgi:hypothetical protein